MGTILAPTGPESGPLCSVDWHEAPGQAASSLVLWWMEMAWSPRRQDGCCSASSYHTAFDWSASHHQESAVCLAQTERLTHRKTSDSAIGKANLCCFCLGVSVGAKIKNMGSSQKELYFKDTSFTESRNQVHEQPWRGRAWEPLLPASPPQPRLPGVLSSPGNGAGYLNQLLMQASRFRGDVGLLGRRI